MALQNILSISLLYAVTGLALASHFRGGHITWKPHPTLTNQIIVTWRLAWKSSGTSTQCHPSVLSSRGGIGDVSNILCKPDCSPSETPSQVTCGNFDREKNWSSGVKTATFEVKNLRSTISYSSGAWISDILNGGSTWNLVAHVDLNRRSDNRNINSPPTTARPTAIYTKVGCSVTIDIPVYDVDGDVVRCRWADGETGGITKPSSSELSLDAANCQIRVMHNTAGFVAIAIAIEDFIPPYTSSSQPLSTIPLQFPVKVNSLSSSVPCSQKPEFMSPTPRNKAVFDVVAGCAINFTLRASSSSPTVPIRAFTTISPQGLIQSDIKDAGNDEKFVIVRWTSIDQEVHDSELFCFSADDDQQSSEQRCVKLNIVSEDTSSPEFVTRTATQVANTDLDLPTAAVSWAPPVADDNCPGLTLTSNHQPGDNFTIGNTTVTYVATDAAGNTVNYAFNVIVADIQPPTFSRLPALLNKTTDPSSATATVWWTSPMISDNSGQLPAMSSDYSPGDEFIIGNTTVTYSAVDVYGNKDTYTFNVIVTDIQPPTFSRLPALLNKTTDPSSATATVWWTSPMISDNSGQLPAMSSDYSPGDEFIIGNTTVTYSAVDVYGNKDTYTFNVIVTDIEPPRIENRPSNRTMYVDPLIGMFVSDHTTQVTWAQPSAHDNSDEPVTLTSNFKPGDSFSVGKTTVTYMAVDTYGNMAKYSFHVQVIRKHWLLWILIGSSVALLILIIGIVIVACRRRSMKSKKLVRNTPPTSTTTHTVPNTYFQQGRPMIPQPEYQDLKAGQPEDIYDDVPIEDDLYLNAMVPGSEDIYENNPVCSGVGYEEDDVYQNTAVMPTTSRFAKGGVKAQVEEDNFYELPESEQAKQSSVQWSNRCYADSDDADIFQSVKF